MAPSEGWDAGQAITRCEVRKWHGVAWRAHGPIYGATDSTGSRRKSGRYHRAPDLFPAEATWAALYLALSREICLGEIIRNVSTLPLNAYRITRLRVELEAVLDCRDAAGLGLRFEELVDGADYGVPQCLAAAALALGAEGMLVPSATLLGDILIVFMDQLRTGSRIEELDYVEPNLAKLPSTPVSPTNK